MYMIINVYDYTYVYVYVYMYIYIYACRHNIPVSVASCQLASAWQLGYHLEMIPSLRVWTECMHECMQETHAN